MFVRERIILNQFENKASWNSIPQSSAILSVPCSCLFPTSRGNPRIGRTVAVGNRNRRGVIIFGIATGEGTRFIRIASTVPVASRPGMVVRNGPGSFPFVYFYRLTLVGPRIVPSYWDVDVRHVGRLGIAIYIYSRLDREPVEMSRPSKPPILFIDISVYLRWNRIVGIKRPNKIMRCIRETNRQRGLKRDLNLIRKRNKFTK